MQALTDAIAFHAAAAKFGISGFTKQLTESSSKISNYISSIRNNGNLLIEPLVVSVVGKNSSRITCTKSVDMTLIHIQDDGWANFGPQSIASVGGREIVYPDSPITFTCKIDGSWEDMGHSLYSVFKEVYTLLKKDLHAKKHEEELLTLEAGLTKNRFNSKKQDEFMVRRDQIEAEYLDRINKYSGFFEPSQDHYNYNILPVNVRTQAIKKGWDREPLVPYWETFSMKNYSIGAFDGCSANLVCSDEKCTLMDDDEFFASEVELSKKIE